MSGIDARLPAPFPLRGRTLRSPHARHRSPPKDVESWRTAVARWKRCLRYTPAGRARLFQEVATMTIRRLAAVLGLTTLLSAPALAQRPMSIIDLISVPVVSAPQLSPGWDRQVVYVQADADWAANKRVSHLWRVRLDGTGTVQLTSGKRRSDRSRGGRRTGKWVAFVGKRDGADARRSSCCRWTGRRSRAADHPRHGGEQPGVVARRPVPLLPGRGRQVRPSSWPVRRPRTTSTPSTRTSSIAAPVADRRGDPRRERGSPRAASRY